MQRGNRTVVQIGCGRPNALQRPTLIDHQRRLGIIDISRTLRSTSLLGGSGGLDERRQRQPAINAEDPLRLGLQQLLLLADQRAGHRILGQRRRERRIGQRRASQERRRRAQKRPGIGLVQRHIAGHPHVGAHEILIMRSIGEYPAQRHAIALAQIHRHRRNDVAAVAMTLLEQPCPVRRQSRIDGPESRGPNRRAKLADLLFHALQHGFVDAADITLQCAGVRLDHHVAEYPDHLAGVATQRAIVEIDHRPRRLVLRQPIPFHPVLLRHIPQERITDRRIGGVHGLVDRIVRHRQQGDLVEDMTDSIQPAKPIGDRPAVLMRIVVQPCQRGIPSVARGQRTAQQGGIHARPQHLGGKTTELVRIRRSADQRGVERFGKRLKIRQRRPAIDDQRGRRLARWLEIDPGGVAGRAVHAHPALPIGLAGLPNQSC